MKIFACRQSRETDQECSAVSGSLQLRDESKNAPLSSEQGSPADGPRGLSVGDIVTGLEDCPVRGVEDWSSCLFHLSHTPQTGYCVPVASLQPSWAHGRGEGRPPPQPPPPPPPPAGHLFQFVLFVPRCAKMKPGHTHRATAGTV